MPTMMLTLGRYAGSQGLPLLSTHEPFYLDASNREKREVSLFGSAQAGNGIRPEERNDTNRSMIAVQSCHVDQVRGCKS